MNNPGDTNTRHDGEEPPAPPRLVAALKELPARRVFVPPAVDQAVLRAARRHLAKPQHSGRGRFRSWLAWPAFATACLALLGLVYFLAKPAGTEKRLAGKDLNHDGQVDILDAFQLARDLQSGQQRTGEFDLNGDGVVDQRDVKVLAAQAVKLEKGGRS